MGRHGLKADTGNLKLEDTSRHQQNLNLKHGSRLAYSTGDSNLSYMFNELFRSDTIICKYRA